MQIFPSHLSFPPTTISFHTQKLSNFAYLNLSIFHFVFFLSDFSIVKETFHILWEKVFSFSSTFILWVCNIYEV